MAAGTKGHSIKVSSVGGSGRHLHWPLRAGGNRQEKFRSDTSLNQDNITKKIKKKIKENHTLKNNLEIPIFLYDQQPRNWQLMLQCVCSMAKKQQNPGLRVNTAWEDETI